jgi:ribosomal protein S2
VGLKLNGTQQLLVYADDVNLLEDNIDSIKKNTETLIDASKVVSLEVNTEKTKYMLLSRNQNAGQNPDIKIANRCFESVAQSRYLRTTITNQTCFRRKLSGN